MRKSRRIALFLMWSTSKNEEVSFDVVNFKKRGKVSQKCCVFDVVNLEKMKKSRRIARFSSLQINR